MKLSMSERQRGLRDDVIAVVVGVLVGSKALAVVVAELVVVGVRYGEW
jgi:hypothetical protein